MNNRRDFIKKSAIAGIGLSGSPLSEINFVSLTDRKNPERDPDKMERWKRTLGNIRFPG